jgi:hypothetical protein
MSGMPTAGMHPQMLAESMHMRGRRYPAGAGGAGIPAGGMPPPAGLGGRGGHMMWYKDMQHMVSPRDAHELPGFSEGYMGGGMVHSSGMLAEHPASNARLQLQVNYLLAENHNLRCENTPNISYTHVYCTHTHTSRTHHMYMFTYIQICMLVVSARIYTCTHTHTHTPHYIYTHTCTHMHETALIELR